MNIEYLYIRNKSKSKEAQLKSTSDLCDAEHTISFSSVNYLLIILNLNR